MRRQSQRAQAAVLLLAGDDAVVHQDGHGAVRDSRRAGLHDHVSVVLDPQGAELHNLRAVDGQRRVDVRVELGAVAGEEHAPVRRIPHDLVGALLELRDGQYEPVDRVVQETRPGVVEEDDASAGRVRKHRLDPRLVPVLRGAERRPVVHVEELDRASVRAVHQEVCRHRHARDLRRVVAVREDLSFPLATGHFDCLQVHASLAQHRGVVSVKLHLIHGAQVLSLVDELL
mmetsp:Transcript_72985/g.176413  ORF Transcript_72985/g.176413 Transcript_72985/m.176413 type:complete len:230 (-) Transcript_72985:120-809(-)